MSLRPVGAALVLAATVLAGGCNANRCSRLPPCPCPPSAASYPPGPGFDPAAASPGVQTFSSAPPCTNGYPR
jgi:hypothetical protein